MDRKRIFEIIERAEDGDNASFLFDKMIVGLIILNVLAIVCESFDSLSSMYGMYFRAFEVFSVIVFTVEYTLRLWTANIKFIEHDGLSSIVKFVLSPMALIDLFAILPFYLPMLLPVDLRFLRMLRLTRLLRIFKLNRYSESLNMLGRVLKREREQLIVTVFITFLMLLLASALMYNVEHDVQPDAFPNILAAFWWAVATLTTVGYGDVYPVTVMGKVLSGVIALLGIGLVALPTGILSSGFMTELEERKKNATHTEEQEQICPHCGEKIRL